MDRSNHDGLVRQKAWPGEPGAAVCRDATATSCCTRLRKCCSSTPPRIRLVSCLTATLQGGGHTSTRSGATPRALVCRVQALLSLHFNRCAFARQNGRSSPGEPTSSAHLSPDPLSLATSTVPKEPLPIASWTSYRAEKSFAKLEIAKVLGWVSRGIKGNESPRRNRTYSTPPSPWSYPNSFRRPPLLAEGRWAV